jgi:hypothetical protein
MNLGIYINSIGNHNQLAHIAKEINKGLSNKQLSDASIFYDGVAHNPYGIHCGMFNSTDLWNFHGHLVVTSLDNAFMAKDIINNIDIYYYYNWEDKKNILLLIKLLKNNIKIICRNQEDADNLYRLTGQKCVGISEDFNNIVTIIAENTDGRFKDRKNVCRSA